MGKLFFQAGPNGKFKSPPPPSHLTTTHTDMHTQTHTRQWRQEALVEGSSGQACSSAFSPPSSAHSADLWLRSTETKGVLGVSCCLVTPSCSTLCDPTDCSPPGSSAHGIFQVWRLRGVGMSFSSSWGNLRTKAGAWRMAGQERRRRESTASWELPRATAQALDCQAWGFCHETQMKSHLFKLPWVRLQVICSWDTFVTEPVFFLGWEGTAGAIIHLERGELKVRWGWADLIKQWDEPSGSTVSWAPNGLLGGTHL